jgi:hypothetical protein
MDMSYRDSNLIYYITVTVLLVAGTAILRGLWNTPEAKARRAGAILPPGPKRNFFIGNLHTFPKTRWYEVFSDWQKEYGAPNQYIDRIMMTILTSESIFKQGT